MTGPVYALNLFNVADRDEYLAYSRRSAIGQILLADRQPGRFASLRI
jgi:hypothetical protein